MKFGSVILLMSGIFSSSGSYRSTLMVPSVTILVSFVRLPRVWMEPSSIEYITCARETFYVSSISTFAFRSLLIWGDAVLSYDLEPLDPEWSELEPTSFRTDFAT